MTATNGVAHALPNEIADLMAKFRLTPKKILDRSSLSRTRFRAIMAGSPPSDKEYGQLCRAIPKLPRRTHHPAPVTPAPKHKTFTRALVAAMAVGRDNYGSVARILEVSSQSVSNWCREVTIPTADNYEKLCDLYPALRDAPRPPGLELEVQPTARHLEPVPAELELEPEPEPEVEEPVDAFPEPESEDEESEVVPEPEEDMPPLKAVPAALPDTQPRELVRLGIQLAGLFTDFTPDNVRRLYLVLKSAGDLKASDVAEFIRDFNPDIAKETKTP